MNADSCAACWNMCTLHFATLFFTCWFARFWGIAFCARGCKEARWERFSILCAKVWFHCQRPAGCGLNGFIRANIYQGQSSVLCVQVAPKSRIWTLSTSVVDNTPKIHGPNVRLLDDGIFFSALLTVQRSVCLYITSGCLYEREIPEKLHSLQFLPPAQRSWCSQLQPSSVPAIRLLNPSEWFHSKISWVNLWRASMTTHACMFVPSE